MLSTSEHEATLEMMEWYRAIGESYIDWMDGNDCGVADGHEPLPLLGVFRGFSSSGSAYHFHRA